MEKTRIWWREDSLSIRETVAGVFTSSYIWYCVMDCKFLKIEAPSDTSEKDD